MRRLGQHFLRDSTILRRIVELLQVKEGECVIEIGPGRGELTNHILKRYPGVPLIALERDSVLASALKEKVEEIPMLEVREGDALELLPLVALGIVKQYASYVLAGNIPYYITGRLMRTLSDLSEKPKRCVFTVQKEVAERITAQPPHMNKLAASVQVWAQPKMEFLVGKSAFQPAPKVDSAVLMLENKEKTGDLQSYYTTVGILFRQPRKTLLNNLFEGLKSDYSNPEMARKAAETILKDAEVDPGDRPGTLTIEAIRSIANKKKV